MHTIFPCPLAHGKKKAGRLQEGCLGLASLCGRSSRCLQWAARLRHPEAMITCQAGLLCTPPPFRVGRGKGREHGEDGQPFDIHRGS